MAADEDDAASLDEVQGELERLSEDLAGLEFRRMFQGEMDAHDAYVEIQAGSGGTEAQDWAEMLLRMYLRWGEKRGMKTEITELSPGDVAGIKGATVQFAGDHAFGWLRTETGVHRLVGSRRSIPAIVAIPLLRRFSFPRKSMTTSKSTSIRRCPRRHLPRQRRRRSACQSNRFRGAIDPSANQHGRAVSERTLSASEQGQGVQAAARQTL